MAIRQRTRRRLTTTTAALALAAPLAPLPAFAQDVSLPPVTVTATGNPLETFLYPGQVSVVDREEIEAVMPNSVGEALRTVPGLDFVGGPRRTGQVPVIRGFDGSDVIVRFDGVRQTFNSGHDGRFFIDPFLLREAEVVKGPTSALYGSGGLGGTLDFRTIEAADFVGADDGSAVQAGTGYSTGNGEDRYQAIGASRFGNVAGLAAVSYRDAGNIDLGDGSTLQNNEKLTSGLVKGEYEFAPGHDATLSWQGYRGDATEPNNPQGVGDGGKVDKDLTNDTVRLGYGLAPLTVDWLDLELTAGYARNKVDEKVIDGDGTSPIGTKLRRHVDSYSLRVDNRQDLPLGDFGSVRLTYGAESFYDDQDGSSTASADGERDGVPDAQAVTGAGFLQGEFTFATGIGDFLVVPGIRFDYLHNNADNQDSMDADEFSPKIGVTYMPTDWLSLFGSYAHAFSAPTFDELYADGTHFTIGPIINSFVANPDLKPQTADNFEVGAGLQFEDVLSFGDYFELKGSYYYYDVENYIDLVVDQPEIVDACFAPPPFGIDCDGTTQAENVADAKLHGFEVEAAYDQEYVALQFGYSHVDGEDDDTGDPLGNLQPDTFTALLTLKAPMIDSTFTWRSVFASRLDRAASGQELSSYSVHDAFVSYMPQGMGLLDGLRLDFGVTNIFDEAYEETVPGAYEEGRSFRAGISYTLVF